MTGLFTVYLRIVSFALQQHSVAVRYGDLSLLMNLKNGAPIQLHVLKKNLADVLTAVVDCSHPNISSYLVASVNTRETYQTFYFYNMLIWETIGTVEPAL